MPSPAPVRRRWTLAELAVEILSPSSEYGDRGPKRRLYQRHVPECWLVDIDARLVERWRPGDERPEILRHHLRWQPAEGSAVFTLDLTALFTSAGVRRQPPITSARDPERVTWARLRAPASRHTAKSTSHRTPNRAASSRPGAFPGGIRRYVVPTTVTRGSPR